MSASGTEIWRLVRRPSGTVEEDLFDIRTVEAANRYASHFEAEIEDPDGTKGDIYTRGQRAEAQYSTDGGQSWTVKQAGFVQRPDETGGGVAAFEALFIGYDHLLRREPVYEDFDDATIRGALQTLITNHTAVTFNFDNVEIVNNRTVSRKFTGERADEVLSWLASASGGEEYGVNDDFEFFFGPPGTETAPQDILDGEWWGYDLPEEGRHAVNSVRVFYGDNSATPRSSVIVENRKDQLQLAEDLGAPRRVVIGDNVHYPDITSREPARTKGREILNRRSPVLTGTVNTFGRYGFEPGQVFRLEIPERGIDDTFLIAEVDHHWAEGTTRVKVAKNTGNVQDLLKSLSDDIVRMDLRKADAEASYSRYITFSAGYTIGASVSATASAVTQDAFAGGLSGDSVAGFTFTDSGGTEVGIDYDSFRSVDGIASAVNGALERATRAWQGNNLTTDLNLLQLGTGTTTPTGTDTELDTATTLLQPPDTSSTPGATTIELSITLDPGDTGFHEAFQEVGLFDSGGKLIARGVLDEQIEHDSNSITEFTISITFANDPDRGAVVTDRGQRRLRDMVGDVVEANNYGADVRAYGSGTNAATESQTSLGSKIGEKGIGYESRGTGSVLGSMEILATESNGSTIAELGDVNPQNELLARLAFEPLDKNSDFALITEIETTGRLLPV